MEKQNKVKKETGRRKGMLVQILIKKKIILLGSKVCA